MRELELDHEVAGVLPDRETLALFTLSFAVIPQTNVGIGVNALSPQAAITIAQNNIGIAKF